MKKYTGDVIALLKLYPSVGRLPIATVSDGGIHQTFDLTHWSRLVDLLSMAWAGEKVNPLNHHLCLWVP
jgi:hypothetical protein